MSPGRLQETPQFNYWKRTEACQCSSAECGPHVSGAVRETADSTVSRPGHEWRVKLHIWTLQTERGESQGSCSWVLLTPILMLGLKRHTGITHHSYSWRCSGWGGSGGSRAPRLRPPSLPTQPDAGGPWVWRRWPAGSGGSRHLCGRKVNKQKTVCVNSVLRWGCS